MTLDAVTIYQTHIDDLSDALLRRDTQAFMARMSHPHLMVTEDCIVKTSSADAAHSNLFEFFTTFNAQNVTDFIRLCSAAHFVTPTRIEGTHVSHMLSGGTRICQPYSNRIRLECINGVWLETAASNAIRRSGGIMSLPIASQDPVPLPLPEFDPERIPQ